MDPQPKKQPFEAHPKEIELLRALREKYRFGEVVIHMRDGLPYRISRTTEYESLDAPRG